MASIGEFAMLGMPSCCRIGLMLSPYTDALPTTAIAWSEAALRAHVAAAVAVALSLQ